MFVRLRRRISRRSLPHWLGFPSNRFSVRILKSTAGRSTLEERPDFLKAGESAQFSSDSGTAEWVRIRREFSVQALFSTVQYSFSHDPKNMVETLIFHVRDPKDLMQVAIEDNASAVTTPASMLSTSTPASRIKLERFGKSSVVLARCPGTEGNPAPDQSAYEPLFQSATAIVTNYRNLLAAESTVPAELARVSIAGSSESKAGSESPRQKRLCRKSPHLKANDTAAASNSGG